MEIGEVEGEWVMLPRDGDGKEGILSSRTSDPGEKDLFFFRAKSQPGPSVDSVSMDQ